MSDEEKKAIEYLKRHIIPCYGRKGTIEFMLNDTVLNLIEKQSKEIERTNEILIWKQRHEEQLQKEIEELKKPKYIINCKTNEITKLTNDFVSKDKIKAKIEELEKLDFGTDLVSQFTANLTTITILQSLLEKE